VDDVFGLVRHRSLAAPVRDIVQHGGRVVGELQFHGCRLSVFAVSPANKNGDTLWYGERRKDKVEKRQKAYN
jgi:hypothetical protein